MPVLFWSLINALQAGALLAIAVGFGIDAWGRKDRMMGDLALTCFLVSLRHGVIAGGEIGLLEPGWVLKAQSILVCSGFVILLEALVLIFPRHLPRRMPLWALVLFTPNWVRNLFLDSAHVLDRPFHHAANAVYVGMAILLVYRVVKAYEDREPMALRLFLGLSGAALPVLVEALMDSVLNQKVRISGLGLLFFAAFLGASWHELIAAGMESRLQMAEARAKGWRRLLPGLTWDSQEPNLLMERTFGKAWANGLASLQRGTDNHLYEVIDTEIPGGRLGWIHVLQEELPPAGFLSGWIVALGMNEGPEASGIADWLRSWGADVELWGTLPPREGPFPSLLLWGREPAILSVWRERDPLRRRARWVQVGGPVTDGPHLRLETPLRREDLEQGLRRLISL